MNARTTHPLALIACLARVSTMSALPVLCSVSSALAQASPAPTSASTPSGTPAADAGSTTQALTPRLTLGRMQKIISLDVKEVKLESVIDYIQSATKAELEPHWLGSGASEQVGLDREKPITLKLVNRPALAVLEAVLEKARTDLSQNSWQMTSEGVLELGPKEVLNRRKRLELYSIADLLFVIPNHPDVPQIDLNNVLQSSSGGSGTSPFNNTNQNQTVSPGEVERRREEAARKIIDLIQSTVEFEQWTDNGGEGGSIRHYNGTLLVNAPDYMHRQINGYPYWPSYTPGVANGRRTVTLNVDTGTSTIDGFAQQPVTGVTGGNGGSGGGGNRGTGGGSRSAPTGKP